MPWKTSRFLLYFTVFFKEFVYEDYEQFYGISVIWYMKNKKNAINADAMKSKEPP